MIIHTFLKLKLRNVPWRRIFTSIRMWAIIIAHFGVSCGFYVLLTELPTYMDSVLHFDLKSVSPH